VNDSSQTARAIAPAEAASSPQSGRLTLSVIVPVYNERATIREILRRVVQRPEVDELVLVDDCSQDGTADLLEQEKAQGWPSLREGLTRPLPAIRLLRHEVNRGKGAALRTGFAEASCDVLITQDADLEYDPADYAKIMEPLYDGRADAVFGSRFAGGPRRVLFFWHQLANKVLTTLSNMLCNLNLTDMETGYKAMRRELVEAMVLKADRFGIEPELTAKLARLRARIYEVPISYSGRSYSEGKKIGWKDGVAAVWTMIRCALTDDRENSDPLHATLHRMAALDRYNGFLFEQIRPAIGQRILEVGAGTGNLTRFLFGRDEVVATDVDPRYTELLARRFEQATNISAVTFDLGGELPAELAARHFDTILCLNVLEHVADDRAALARLRDRLEPGGRLILLVPAHRGLYGSIDRAIGHYRRYERNELERLLVEGGFEIESLFHVNATSIPGWYLNGRVLRRESVPGIQARLADRLVPLYRLERRLGIPFGLSIITFARRPAA
jgi:glycosyltransferase involved in cell wall biosynthesis